MTNVLVVAAHPDDEVLGCGALVAAMARHGCSVTVVFATDGEGARGGGEALTRARCAEEAARTLGALPPLWLGFPDQRLDAVLRLEIIRHVERVVADCRPDLILTHDRSDLNLDHRILCDAVSVAARPVPLSTCRALLTFETPSATDYGTISGPEGFQPNLFVDASGGFEVKLAALRCYEAELRSPPHPRSIERIEALARVRGAAAGLDIAEAFRIVYARGTIAPLLQQIGA